MLRLHDTASGALAPATRPGSDAVAMYVCGPTVYAPPHVGHGRFMLVYDVLRRYLEFCGFAVRHVSNVTDIDDKIIIRAQREGRRWQDVAAEAEGEWWAAMDALGILRPTVIPHATGYIDEMNAVIAALVERGAAYETDDGVYLAVDEVAEYGLLAHQRAEDRRAGARVDVDEHKRAPEDFVLWKKAKPGEPEWPSPFGPGRPGWHTECVAMALNLLGDEFDLHGGGLDLVFPHHENERAQAVQLGRSFARVWVHNGMVTMGGEKMSKSIGNVLDLASLVAGSDPRAYRLLVLRSQYRSPLEVGSDLLDDAARALARIDALARRVPPDAVVGGADVEALRSSFIAAMDDDLDTPRAVALLFDALRRANAALDGSDEILGASLAAAALELFGAMGVFAPSGGDHDLDEWALGRAADRDRARSLGEYAESDAIRAELEAAGWVVEDTANGTRIRR